MHRRTALARLGDVAANDVLPLAHRLLSRARRSLDELTLTLQGPDFDERVRTLRRRYQQMGGDPFGLDPDAAKHAITVCAFFHRLYFRTEVYGVEHVPDGPVLLAANHSGQLPLDAAIIGTALFLDADPPRVTRAMVEKWTQTLPFVSTFYSRVGQVVGVPENCLRLLEMGELILVFPEGTRGISKPFTQRYQLEQFGLGFMRLALKSGAPIVPVAVIGAEEQYISLGNLRWAARALGMPVFPVIPQLLIPGGQLPLPVKYRLYFGEPMRFTGDADDDDRAIEQKVWIVRQTVQWMIGRGLRQRKGIFF
jgi:1-acyl-sn-glycerol-3-phosphate acyltransferase